MRRCVGCMRSLPKPQLIRLADTPDGIAEELSGRGGRGVYLCVSEDCLSKAIKKNAFSRSFKRKIEDEEYDRLREALRLHAEGSLEVM
ncbi:MAG: YlxR family protein [Firmicutes bacterium]|nr:YlxR family protein [Bacillota bacterium]